MREFRRDKLQQHVTVAPTLILHLFESRVPASRMTDIQADVTKLAKLTNGSQVVVDKALTLATRGS
jgi:hypothetical protein